MVIRKIKSGWRLYSRKINPKTGKRRNLGTYKSKKEVIEREKQVQFFKHKR